MEYVAFYFIGAFLMLVWARFMSSADHFYDILFSIIWPLTLPLMIVVIPFYKADEKGYHIRFVNRKYDILSKWGYRKSTNFKYGCAIRCPWFEVQLFNSNIRKEYNA